MSSPEIHPAKPPFPAQGDGGQFAPTQWSLVMLAAKDAAASRQALERLCKAYLPPVFAFFRREGFAEPDAQDMTQEFFSRLLAANSFADATPHKGKFRSWLIGAMKHFIISDHRRNTRLKRGGGQVAVSLDGMTQAMRDACAPRDEETPERAYDRRWAETLITRVNERLEKEFSLENQADRYAALRPYLPKGEAGPSYVETAQKLGLSEAAAKSAIFKIRRRFGVLLRHEVAQTVATPEEVEDEMRALLAALIDS